ncbi:DNA primase, partial [Myxococcota bacterium]|nr:DNA primase [Myxococcota bacterium]
MALTSAEIDQVRQRADIVDLIGDFVRLRRQGKRHVGLCPFHDEKTASFSVTGDKGFFYCFGCHKGGDAIQFVIEHQGLDFQSAVRFLATRFGVQLTPESPAAQKRKKEQNELEEINLAAWHYFAQALGAPPAAAARAYLQERKIPPDQARLWGIGFGGPPGGLLAYFKEKNIELSAVARAGMLNEDEDRSLFDGRLVIPIRNGARRIIGYGGRRLGDSSGPKYINSRESELYKKSRSLFGIEKAQDAMRRGQSAVIVEGYFDVMACYRAGVKGAVAAQGTAFTPEHAEALAKYTKAATILLDGDAAGERASRKVAERLVSLGISAKVALLPKGEDPDSLLNREGPSALANIVGAARSAVEYFVDRAFDDEHLSIEEKVTQGIDLGSLILALSSGLERDLYTARIAEQVGVPVEGLQKEWQKEWQKLKTKEKSKKRTETSPRESGGGVGNERDHDFSDPGPHFQDEPSPEDAPEFYIDGVEVDLLMPVLIFPELRTKFGDLAEYARSQGVGELLEDLSSNEESLSEVMER